MSEPLPFNSRIHYVNGIDLFTLDHGSGEPVLLLHGFPDSHRLWRHQVPFLLERGFRVIAPDLRGFGASSRPEGVGAYSLHHIVSDLVSLLQDMSLSRVHLVGHDFGAVLAWSFAAMVPRAVDRLAVMSVGHPMSFRRNHSVAQREKSWYMLFFQFEEVAEMALQAEDWQLLRELVRHHPECDRWIADLSRPGALTAALNWYRANMKPKLQGRQPVPAVSADTLGIWSDEDPFLLESQMRDSAHFVRGQWRFEALRGAGHWMQLDAPDQVNHLLSSFLKPD
ncbi:Alpha/beta fold hydrolase [Sulfidibacter corallicola]|uniref:Alpha/beta fold hydrolase n=1 Tax=Sulfidibacter corallicola TaxID=2818388 RepID=A0A8A4TI25_SULCO|nr:alpha/beta fold hydrolase [Sulfidibacter corallicola]QTD49147.1 alpha/beta fold hydrolase [Sulfidibacter corallicola]